ncbi:aldose epimerase family protein [Oleiharenicola lentus]|uniref:aldose epimerase family protein n=1 Tax=Oleiharenicola lentus TaxID=2508720 RepID=UPI003F664C86
MNPVTSRVFGHLPTGEAVRAWTLSNARGASLEVIEYGGIVTRLLMPDRHGKLADVVLGFASLPPYLDGHPYFGAIAGRVAGRITGAEFSLAGQRYPLARNDPPNHLHGGKIGFDKRLWHAAPLSRADGAASVRLTLHSPDGDEGYPGAIDATVDFTLTARDEFIFETEVRANRVTPANLTHHSYFNLAGEASGSMETQTLQLHADTYAPSDEFMTLLGRRESVAGQGNDFRNARKIGDALPEIFKQHGDVYFINRPADQKHALVPAARAHDAESGRILIVSSTEDCIQFYSGAGLDGSLRGKSGAPYRRYQGFCLECEGYPDGANRPDLGDIMVRPDRPRRETTIYAFSTDSV